MKPDDKFWLWLAAILGLGLALSEVVDGYVKTHAPQQCAEEGERR